MDIDRAYEERLTDTSGDKVAAALLVVADVLSDIDYTLTQAMGDDESLYNVLINAAREHASEAERVGSK